MPKSNARARMKSFAVTLLDDGFAQAMWRRRLVWTERKG
jgi:hypothetical protein